MTAGGGKVGLLVRVDHSSEFNLVVAITSAIDAAKSKFEFKNGYCHEVHNENFRARFGKGQYGLFGDRRRPAEPEINNCGYYSINRNKYTVVHNVKRDGCVTLRQGIDLGSTECFIGTVEVQESVSTNEYKKLIELSGWFVERVLYHFSERIESVVVYPNQKSFEW